MIVLDANILIRAVLGRRVRELLDTWAEARERIEDRDENDWPVLATALALACAICTEDADFFGAGIAVWTTNRIEIFFKQQLKAMEPDQE